MAVQGFDCALSEMKSSCAHPTQDTRVTTPSFCLQVAMQDFDRALSEVKPAFGAVTETLEQHRLNGIINCGEHFRHLQSTCRTLVEQVRCCLQSWARLPVMWICGMSNFHTGANCAAGMLLKGCSCRYSTDCEEHFRQLESICRTVGAGEMPIVIICGAGRGCIQGFAVSKGVLQDMFGGGHGTCSQQAPQEASRMCKVWQAPPLLL